MEIVKPAFWTDFKAILGLATLEVWLCLSVVNYCSVIAKKYVLPANFLSNPYMYFFLGLMVFWKIAAFIYKDRWKGYISEFDTWPKEKTRKWKIIAWIFIIAIVANLVFSFYLMSRVDWSQYR